MLGTIQSNQQHEKTIKDLKKKLRKEKAWIQYLICYIYGEDYKGMYKKEFEEEGKLI